MIDLSDIEEILCLMIVGLHIRLVSSQVNLGDVGLAGPQTDLSADDIDPKEMPHQTEGCRAEPIAETSDSHESSLYGALDRR